MARKERNSADYFPHIIGSGRKMFVIERKFGNDGYASWFKILETLAITEYHFIDLSQEDQLIYLAAKCNVDEDLLIKILDELSKIDAINKFLWSKKIVWSDYFIENIADAYLRRNNKCIQFEDLCIRLGINCIRYVNGLEGNVYINPHTKVEYIILDKIIPKETKPKPPKAVDDIPLDEFSFIPLDWKPLVKEWAEFRKSIRKPIKSLERSFSQILKLSNNNIEVAKKIIEQSIDNEWQGLFELKNINQNYGIKPTIAERARSSREQAARELANPIIIDPTTDFFSLPKARTDESGKP